MLYNNINKHSTQKTLHSERIFLNSFVFIYIQIFSKVFSFKNPFLIIFIIKKLVHYICTNIICTYIMKQYLTFNKII